MVCPKNEEQKSAPKSCHEQKSFGPWGKTQQHHHHHHHHHHHIQLDGMKWNAVPQEKHGHCHSRKSWWGHQKCHKEFQTLELQSEAALKPKCFFRGLRDKEHYQKSGILFDYSENYN